MSPDPLATFLETVRHREFVWGEWDCLLWLGAYVQVCRGVDPSEPWHGRYRTELGARQLVKKAGGMKTLVGGALAGIGVKRVEEASRGDIALVGTPSGDTGAILIDRRWVALNFALRGVVFWTTAVAPVRVAWRL